MSIFYQSRKQPKREKNELELTIYIITRRSRCPPSAPSPRTSAWSITASSCPPRSIRLRATPMLEVFQCKRMLVLWRRVGRRRWESACTRSCVIGAVVGARSCTADHATKPCPTTTRHMRLQRQEALIAITALILLCYCHACCLLLPLYIADAVVGSAVFVGGGGKLGRNELEFGLADDDRTSRSLYLPFCRDLSKL
jgi:hypothetical protein